MCSCDCGGHDCGSSYDGGGYDNGSLWERQQTYQEERRRRQESAYSNYGYRRPDWEELGAGRKFLRILSLGAI